MEDFLFSTCRPLCNASGDKMQVPCNLRISGNYDYNDILEKML